MLAPARAPVTGPALAETAAATAAKTKPLAPAADATLFAPLTQPEDKRRRRRTLFAIAAALMILLLLTGGVLVFETTRLPTLDVSPKIATFGDHVVVTATRVPRDQTGEIRLESVLHTFPFRADKAGKVSAELAVPKRHRDRRSHPAHLLGRPVPRRDDLASSCRRRFCLAAARR